MSQLHQEPLEPDNGENNNKTSHLHDWVTAIGHIARHYRLEFSPGGLQAAASWQQDKPLAAIIQNLGRQAGLSGRLLNTEDSEINSWRLPLVIQLNDGQVGIIETYDGKDGIGVSFISDAQLVTQLSFSELLPDISHIAAFRPVAAVKDIRADRYLAEYTPNWLRNLVMRDIRPYWYVMLASLIINVMALSGIIFSMQVYDRVIPAQSYPTLYVLFGGVMIAIIFSFIMRLARGHVTDILGKRADLRVSDRVFGHALRLRNSAVPRSTGSFISQVRELEQVREMVTSTTVSAIVDMPFFLLFMGVLIVISPYLSWIAPVATVLMLVPGLLLQKKLARLARQATMETTLRNAILVESLQGLEDIKLMQAEQRFQQQWNSYIQITAQSGMATRRLTQGLISWGMTVQSLVYATVVMIGAPLVINGDITTGAVVAASMLSSRMIAPMTSLCGVLARWQQVKAAKDGLDNIMQLPVENGGDEARVHCATLYGDYYIRSAVFRYDLESNQIPLRVNKLDIRRGERIAVLGRNGAGKSTFLQALSGGVELVDGELRLDNLSLPHIDVADLRRNIGLLTQNARMFHGTLRDNLTMGAPHARDEDIFAVLEVCGAADFIKRLPLGLEHQIMEGGLGLSGGQRQSVLLARMLLRDPNIVLLDEPTASLDEHTERDFLQRLSGWLAGRTLIIATHRAAVLELADRVLVLKDGALVMDAPKDKAMNRAEDKKRTLEVSDENKFA
ncbi:type I secretion system permease/ATPase [Erwinia sp. JUb26]|uniref:type I secretion system permease/ATPase n=1 Tax=Erwinia sp. JUb26 TaxID=2485126 RepID=UPI000F47EB76|nr:type I secretion system permease/ATPase [Erwinia sp. JUb26]ROR11138.1 ATP-binding cassette subfamily C protein LapB [Erwinia sp. JUb26]